MAVTPAGALCRAMSPKAGFQLPCPPWPVSLCKPIFVLLFWGAGAYTTTQAFPGTALTRSLSSNPTCSIPVSPTALTQWPPWPFRVVVWGWHPVSTAHFFLTCWAGQDAPVLLAPPVALSPTLCVQQVFTVPLHLSRAHTHTDLLSSQGDWC